MSATKTRSELSTRWSSAALLEALPDAAAVLDRAGRIVAVNRTWREAVDFAGPPAHGCAVGANYLQRCRRAACTGCPEAPSVVGALTGVLDGALDEVELEYLCPSSAGNRWYLLRVTRLAGRRPGVLVSHVDISVHKRVAHALQRKADQDPLTGLANRSALRERLTEALLARPGRESTPDVGVLYLDLDGFKPINDHYGHAVGDEVLQAVAVRLGEVTRPLDTLARLGGDEFAVVAPRITGPAVRALAARVEAAITAPIVLGTRTVSVGVSVGHCLAAPGEDPELVLQRADEAMYAAKRVHHARSRAVGIGKTGRRPTARVLALHETPSAASLS